MMRLNSRADNMGIKQEGYGANSLSSLRQNPRIVRVSRLFGGKDRHSKVCTVRGLRDRRIRLSVTTAIQLYDLQDRLGLSQPSKVIDWLLEAAKNDVDLLPPLQFPPGFHHMNPNLATAGESFPGMFQSFDLGSCSTTRTDQHSSQRANMDLEKRQWAQFDQSSNRDNDDHDGFDMNHHPFSNSVQRSNSYHYNLGHLQQSLLDQSGNVTVAFSNNTNNNHNLNPSATVTMSSLFPKYPSFLGSGQLHQLFSSNSNSSKQTDHVE